MCRWSCGIERAEVRSAHITFPDFSPSDEVSVSQLTIRVCTRPSPKGNPRTVTARITSTNSGSSGPGQANTDLSSTGQGSGGPGANIDASGSGSSNIRLLLGNTIYTFF